MEDSQNSQKVSPEPGKVKNNSCIELNKGGRNPKTKTAISVQNAYKSYANGIPVLQNFSMTAPQGTIYSLLGASGCGKTTMLSCIVGISNLDKGNIFVFGQRPGTPESGIPGRSVGFMPQGITLYMKLSIKETLEYFGRIYGMSHIEINSRMEFLRNFLDLPIPSRKLHTLSGGQQRRVSLAVCLLHEPSLLILDEPTVGVDPILRQSIWKYLCELVSQKQTTIIITTHYIEESRQSNTIGLMRNGCLITESSPQALLQEHNTILLEEIVIQLCKKDNQDNPKDEISMALNEISFYQNGFIPNQWSKKESQLEEDSNVIGLTFRQRLASLDLGQGMSSNPGVDKNPKILKRPLSFREQTVKYSSLKVSKIKALTIRKALNLCRDPIVLFVMFIVPSINMLLVTNFIGKEPKSLRFGVVNPETNNDIDQCHSQPRRCNVNMSCAYLNSLSDSIINPVSMHSKAEALENVRNGNLWGYMEFPQNYSQHLTDRVLAGNFAENETLETSEILFQMDMSQFFAGQLLQKSFYESYQNFAKEMLKDCDQDLFKAELPLNFRKPIYGHFEGNYQYSIIPAILIVITFFLPGMTGSLSVITDRKEGTLDRSMVAGITRTDFLIAFCIAEGITICIQCLISYLSLLFLLDGAILGSHLAFITVLILIGVAGLCFSFLLAQFCQEEFEAAIILVGFFISHLPITALVWPIQGSSLIVRGIAYLLPCNWGISAVRSIISRGWPISHSQVWPTYLLLCIWIILNCFLALRFWRKSS